MLIKRKYHSCRKAKASLFHLIFGTQFTLAPTIRKKKKRERVVSQRMKEKVKLTRRQRLNVVFFSFHLLWPQQLLIKKKAKEVMKEKIRHSLCLWRHYLFLFSFKRTFGPQLIRKKGPKGRKS